MSYWDVVSANAIGCFLGGVLVTAVLIYVDRYIVDIRQEETRRQRFLSAMKAQLHEIMDGCRSFEALTEPAYYLPSVQIEGLKLALVIGNFDKQEDEQKIISVYNLLDHVSRLNSAYARFRSAASGQRTGFEDTDLAEEGKEWDWIRSLASTAADAANKLFLRFAK